MTTRTLALAAVPDRPARTMIAFEELYLAHYEGVYRLLYRIIGTREEAEDLAQEAFLRLHRSPRLWRHRDERGDGPAEHNVRGWLYRVAANLAFNALRSRTRRLGREERTFSLAPTQSDRESDPAEELARSEDRRAVRLALLALPERQAQLLLLRHAGLSYRELAETVGVAPGSVGTLLARAEAAFEQAYLANTAVHEGGEDGL